MFSFQGAFKSLKRLSETSIAWCFNQSLNFPLSTFNLLVVESTGIEPVTSCLQGRRSPSWANPPFSSKHISQNTHLHKRKCLVASWFLLFHSNPLRWALNGALGFIKLKWWAKMDSNHRPHDYQSCALASWAIGPFCSLLKMRLHIFGLCPLNWIT